MPLIILTRIFITAYGFVTLILLIRFIGLKLIGEKRNNMDVSTIALWPLYLLTKSGQEKLRSTLKEWRK